MKTRIGTRRKARLEALEARQLLHGGGFLGGDVAAVAESAFIRLDTNEDAVINADDGVSERLLERLAEADTDGEAGISQTELTAHLEARAAERADHAGGRFRGGRGFGRSGGRMGPLRPGAGQSLTERLDLLYENDADGNGLTAGEVSERVWDRISAADTDTAEGGEVSISREELEAHIEAKRSERLDAAFARLDTDESGGVTVDEVSERQWERLSEADTTENGGNADGIVTQEELQNYAEARRAEREAAGGGNQGVTAFRHRAGFGGRGGFQRVGFGGLRN